MSGDLIDLSADGHIHTRFCNHASGEMADYAEAALQRGLKEITFLEHLEADIRYDHRTWLRERDFDEYFRIGTRLADRYRDVLCIHLGVEAGFNPQAMDIIQERLTRYPFACIGLSYHFYPDGNRHLNMVSRREDNLRALSAIGPDLVKEEYFQGLLLGLQHLPCDKLCHLDGVLRHLPEHSFNARHRELIEEILQRMKKKGVALEVNTSGFAVRDMPYPTRDIVLRAVELGIPLAAGSDAHRPDQVGRYFDRLPAWLAGEDIRPSE